MTPHPRTYAVATAAAIAALATGPAHAATVTVPNACLYSLNDEYRNQPVILSGVGSPAGAPAGATVTLSGASITAALPDALPEEGYNLSLFHEGYNAIPSKVWIAIAASNATPALQLQQLSVVASTTIVLKNGQGSEFVSGTPIVVTIPIPDTTWTVLAGGPVTFSQAGPGTLGSLPVGLNDKVQPVIGSIIVKPSLGSLRFVLDCQPGSTVAPFKTLTPATAAPFATLEAPVPAAPVVAPAPPPPPPPPPAATVVAPALRITSPRGAARNGHAVISIACPPGTAACLGVVTVRSMLKARIGGRRRFAQITEPTAYVVDAGSERRITLALTRLGRHLTQTLFRTLRVQATLSPAPPPSGRPASGGHSVTRVMTLDR